MGRMSKRASVQRYPLLVAAMILVVMNITFHALSGSILKGAADKHSLDGTAKKKDAFLLATTHESFSTGHSRKASGNSKRFLSHNLSEVPDNSLSEGTRSAMINDLILQPIVQWEPRTVLRRTCTLLPDVHLDLQLPRIMAKLRSLLGGFDAVVDVGANLGQFALPLGKLEFNVFSFEPVKKTCDLLRRNVLAARLSEKVHVTCAGVAEVSQVAAMSESKRSSGNQVVLHPIGNQSDLTEVPFVKLDDTLDDRPTMLFKTDTQGFELNVLKGSKAWIIHNRPLILLVELSHALLRAQNTSVVEVLDFIYTDLAYRCV